MAVRRRCLRPQVHSVLTRRCKSKGLRRSACLTRLAPGKTPVYALRASSSTVNASRDGPARMACHSLRPARAGVRRGSRISLQWRSFSVSTATTSRLMAKHVYSDADFEELKEWREKFKMEHIPRGEFDIRFSKSSGPGGQNVNKNDTKADVRFELAKAFWMPRYARNALSMLHAGRLTKDGWFVIKSQTYRSQKKNLEDCFDKLYKLVMTCSLPPSEASPEQVERVKELKKKANEKRLRLKKMARDRRRQHRGEL